MLANCVKGPTAAHTLASNYVYPGTNAFQSNLKYRDYSSIIISNYRFDDTMYLNVQFDIKEHTSKYLKILLSPFIKQVKFDYNLIIPLIDKNFKYCPTCMAIGYHAIYHQFSFLDKCLIHNVDLINTCPFCKEKMEFGIFFSSSNAPFCCSKCKRILIKAKFEFLIGEWLSNRNNNLSFSPFINYEKHSPVLLISHGDGNYIESKKILNIIRDMFMGNVIKRKAVLFSGLCINNWYEYRINNQVERRFENYEYKEIIRSYYIAFLLISRHIRKSKHINKKSINNIEQIVKLNMTNEKKCITNNVLKMTNYNAYVFYLWKREIEYNFFDFTRYNINAAHNSKYYFTPNNEILDLLINHSKQIMNIIDDSKLLLNILIRIAYLLLFEKYKLWEKHVKHILKHYNEFELVSRLGIESLKHKETISNEILILIDKKYNCKLYTD